MGPGWSQLAALRGEYNPSKPDTHLAGDGARRRMNHCYLLFYAGLLALARTLTSPPLLPTAST